MTTITTINWWDNITDSRAVLNTNFSNLNTDKQEVLSEWAFVDGDKTKLDWIAAWSTANSTDAFLLDRTNHTWTQAATTVWLWNVDNTSDANKPVSTTQQTEIDTKEDSFAKNTAFNKAFWTTAWTVLEWDTVIWDVTLIWTETLTNKTLTSPVINTPTGIIKWDVGLGNVDNTSDVNKPVSTAQQTGLDLKTNNTDSVTSVAWTPAGWDRISKIISLTTAEYTAATKIATTLYIITDA